MGHGSSSKVAQGAERYSKDCAAVLKRVDCSEVVCGTASLISEGALADCSQMTQP